MPNNSKYSPPRVSKLLEALRDGSGRVRAVKIAGIQYHTFIKWLEEEHGFADLVNKAESVGFDKIKDICERRIIENKTWTSAAWWLERKYPEQYRQRYDVNNNNRVQIVDESE